MKSSKYTTCCKKCDIQHITKQSSRSSHLFASKADELINFLGTASYSITHDNNGVVFSVLGVFLTVIS